jgi:demethylmenaquinone methyltransferase/2-methoxy-6-polyprenyl-1,4-benzoquinol methylase
MTPKVAFFDHAAGGGSLRFNPGDEVKLETLCRRLGDLRGRRVLEPGCGAGALTPWLARWTGPDGQVEAFDPSAKMLAHAAINLRGIANVRLSRTRCEDAEWPAGAFDLVVCFRVFPHFDDVDTVLARFHRWLAAGGRLVIAHWDGRASLNSLHARHGPLEQDVFPRRSDLEPALRRHGFRPVAWIEDASEIYVEAAKLAADG